MRLPLTRYGLPQLVVYPLAVLILMLLLFTAAGSIGSAPWIFPAEALLFIALIWMLSFFRDPPRNIACDETVFYSPADGTITDISLVDDIALGRDGQPARALRIGMFLSIFNVHINRVPCRSRVEKINYRKGKFKNAMSGDAGRINESNDILMLRLDPPCGRFLVRQISGAVARHIVCEAREGSEYRQGEPFGMIKFGSRAELYIPAGKDGERRYEVTVKRGDAVRAGLTPLVRYLPLSPDTPVRTGETPRRNLP